MLQGDTPIASGVFHNLLQKYTDDYRGFMFHLQDPYGPHHIISAKNISQISGKMLDFRYPYKYKTWSTVLQGEASIAAKVLHNLPQMYKDGWTSFR